MVAAKPVAQVHPHNGQGATSPVMPEFSNAARAASTAAEPKTRATPTCIGLQRHTSTHTNATAATISTLCGTQPCINEGPSACAITTAARVNCQVIAPSCPH